MKICTITCHDVYNVGASLQAYALQTYLKLLGHDVKIIDYKPDYLSKHYRLDIVGNPKYDKPFLKQAYLLAKLPGRLRMLPRKKAFDSFTAKYLDLTKRYTSNEELKKEPPEADAFLAGSDQIWNPLFPNGKDPVFYLDFALHGIRASYAASFAVDEFPQELREVTAQYLKRFDHIAVREKSGLSVLKTLGITNAVTVLDPVFLLDRAQWGAMAERPEGCVSGSGMSIHIKGNWNWTIRRLFWMRSEKTSYRSLWPSPMKISADPFLQTFAGKVSLTLFPRGSELTG